jgi:hypothetical protein
MKQVTFAVVLVAVGLVVGLVMPGVFAQTPQAEVQKWQQFCEDHTQGVGGKKNSAVSRANRSAATHGTGGYQLVSGASRGQATLVLCYRRPVQ